MARYIDADLLKESLKESKIMLHEIYEGLKHDEDKQICAGQLTTLTECLLRIYEQPTADVVEVRHGEWIKKNGIYVCSECDFTCPYDVVGDNIEYWECLYCRNCGAKMDGGKAE